MLKYETFGIVFKHCEVQVVQKLLGVITDSLLKEESKMIQM